MEHRHSSTSMIVFILKNFQSCRSLSQEFVEYSVNTIHIFLCEVNCEYTPLPPGHCHLQITQLSELRQYGCSHLGAFTGDILAWDLWPQTTDHFYPA